MDKIEYIINEFNHYKARQEQLTSMKERENALTKKTVSDTKNITTSQDDLLLSLNMEILKIKQHLGLE